MVQNQWYHFGIGAPPILVHFSGDRDAHRGYDSGFDPWPYEPPLFEWWMEPRVSFRQELVLAAVTSKRCTRHSDALGKALVAHWAGLRGYQPGIV